ncbi:nitroreductase family deazaflavin-dependent oxidoreductase [Nonomuraea sp. NPDC005983]|uniref:nitroreductase family deazaflavin-dependent oxidoreductase n=1 Tax=Nonomuraea sp. NPDC005983 TaxID=3155595 RepID=UPI0033BB298B
MSDDFNKQVIEEFRANGGVVGGPFEGAALALLTTTGAKSGKQTTSPVMYFQDGGNIYVVASNGGQDHHPAWYHNLRANPALTVEIGTESFTAKAELFVEGEERDRLFAHVVSIAPGFADYQAGTTRRIPIAALHRTTA